MPQQDELRGIVERMIAAGEPEAAIAAVIQAYTPAHDEHSVSGFGSNVLSSGGKMLSDTAKGLLSIPGYVVKMATTDPVKGGQEIIDAVKNAPGAIKDYVSSRYGSLGQAGETLYHDPVGVAGDVSTVAGLGAATRVPKVAGALAKVEALTNPLNAVTKPMTGALRMAGPQMQALGLSQYERLLKPKDSTLRGMPRMGPNIPERQTEVARRLIEDPHGQITKRGVSKFDEATRDIQQQVDDLVAQNPTATGSGQHVLDELTAARGRHGTQWAPGGDLRSFDAVADDVLANPALADQMPAGTARELTQGTYGSLGDKAYGEIAGPAVEAHKAAARGGRAILNEAIPAVEPLNLDISNRLDLGQVQKEAVGRGAKHDLFSLGQIVAASHGNPAFMALTLPNRQAIGSPLARGLYRGGKSAAQAGIDPELLRAALLARLTGAVQDE